MKLNTYLTFNGQCKEAFEFYERCLGGKIEFMMTHAGAPVEQHVPPEWRDKILHASLTVGDTVLTACDAPPESYQPARGFYVHLALEDTQDAERIFQALSENGKVGMPLDQTFWATRFGMLVDRFGTPWMVNCGQAAVSAGISK